MKGDVISLSRTIAFRLAFAAFLLSLISLVVFAAGNIQELSDRALILTLGWAVGSSLASLVFALLAILSSLAAPFLSGRISPLTLLGSILIMAANLAVLAAASALRAVTGGLSL